MRQTGKTAAATLQKWFIITNYAHDLLWSCNKAHVKSIYLLIDFSIEHHQEVLLRNPK